ncbi:Helix-turn-helix domain [Chelatococcus sambhunathii]|uniref:Helix-turn-helix domain n=1 Tax=Chelatococcus sambhunathii TaxID=363953 RepID=A0ABP2AC06_9HYPH|nr:helix-turn-helix domain-containing protein [Chelatococcus sambhunathii]CUA90977.1 Helix-turn-helix domain [Chelatococcus sambhunathii]
MSALAALLNLSPQARKIHDHMVKAGSISAREAMADYGITSATLARRICDIEEAGFVVKREQRVHPIHKRKYTRYSIDSEAVPPAPAPEPFKVGDRVRVREGFPDEEDVGRMGKVIRVRPAHYTFPFEVLLDGDSEPWPVRATEIERVED